MVSAARFLPAAASAASIARSRSLRPQNALVASASLADIGVQFANVFFRKPTAACAALSRARALPSTVAPTAPQFLSAAA